MKDNLSDVSREEAVTVVPGLTNSILALTYHIHYYVVTIRGVLLGGPLDAHDKFSFEHPAIETDEEWQLFLLEVWKTAEELCDLIEQLTDDRMDQHFVDEKYGNYIRNLLGLIEHTHYHLGQIVVIKKIVRTAGYR
ncbi:DinB family protein [Nostoc ellipsosporum NOK]|nr:DinB family protein [Nostoc ellipsosporum NOK]